MYQYACAALGVDCTFSTTAETPEEVKQAVFEHAEVVHKDMLQAMTPEEMTNLQKAVDAAIVPV